VHTEIGAERGFVELGAVLRTRGDTSVVARLIFRPLRLPWLYWLQESSQRSIDFTRAR
jgi:hypothetical protein